MSREEKLAKKRAYNKVYYAKNRDDLVEKKRVYREQNRELVNQSQRDYVQRNIEVVKDRKREYYSKNRDKILKSRQEKSEQMKETRKKYRALNADKIRKYNQKHYQNSIQYRLAHILRARVRDAVKREHKSLRTKELLGISIKDYKDYLENLFIEGMTWANYGEWEIDHIKPLASFDLTQEVDQLKAFHYTNTQPLWYPTNRKKSAKILD